jgi:hypothetical protein
MRVRNVLLPVLLASIASTASAQNDECAIYLGPTGNVCNAAVDGTRLFHPIAGLLVSGGNPVIGTAQSLGGFPHLFVGVRANLAKVGLPDLSYDGSSSTVPLDDEMIFPSPVVEAGLGIWKGMSSGFLSIDALASAQLLPPSQIENLTVDEDATKISDIALGLGYGARVGILEGSFPIPSVSVSAMRRTIPQVQYGDIRDPGQDYQYAVDLQATNLRATAGYQLAVLNVAAGLGWDKYTGNATILFRDPASQLPLLPIELELDNTRLMMFFDALLDLSGIALAAEIGYQAGEDQELPTTFEGIDDTQGKMFGGVGIRFGF